MTPDQIIQLMQEAYNYGDHWDDCWGYVYTALVRADLLKAEKIDCYSIPDEQWNILINNLKGLK